VIRHHGDAAAYVFARSQPSLMRALVFDHELPLYGQDPVSARRRQTIAMREKESRP